MHNSPNVVILAGGFGNRFRESDYSDEKPLIEVFGKPQIAWALTGAMASFSSSHFFIAARTEILGPIVEKVEGIFPNLITEYVDIGESTLGPAHSLKIFTERSREISLQSPLISCDNDCLNIIEVPFGTNFLSVTESSNPAHCYVSSNDQGMVTALHEKQIIGNIALSGNYGFESAAFFLDLYEKTNFERKEQYLSDVVSQSFVESVGFKQVKSSTYFSLGTPEEIANINSQILEYK
jgi:NDP-sugar pyrophosphorylase family protein